MMKNESTEKRKIIVERVKIDDKINIDQSIHIG